MVQGKSNEWAVGIWEQPVRGTEGRTMEEVSSHPQDSEQDHAGS